MKNPNNISIEEAMKLNEVEGICFRCEDGEVKFAGHEGIGQFAEPRQYYWLENNINKGAI